MSVMAEIYISRDDQEAARYNTSSDGFPDREQYSGFTELELSTLWAGVRGVPWSVDLLDEFPKVLSEDGGERVICRLPAAMATEMANLRADQIASTAAKWAATDEMRCQPADVRPIIEGLVRLAKKASDTGRSLYFWNSL
jgi:hypothetical protein